MFKRIAALLLSVSMVAGLAACSNTTTTTSTAPDGSNGDDATTNDNKVDKGKN